MQIPQANPPGIVSDVLYSMAIGCAVSVTVTVALGRLTDQAPDLNIDLGVVSYIIPRAAAPVLIAFGGGLLGGVLGAVVSAVDGIARHVF